MDRAKQAQARWEINLPGMNYECDRKWSAGWAGPCPGYFGELGLLRRVCELDPLAAMNNLKRCSDKDSILAIVRMERTKAVMAKVTSKYQVTVPRTIADKYNIRPGDDIDWVAAGEVIRVIPPGGKTPPADRASRLHLFDQATERHRRRPSARKTQHPRDRGWTREDLYIRGRAG